MRKILFVFLFINILGSISYSQKVVRLYENKAPGSEDWNYKEIEYQSLYFSQKCYRNVVDPTLEVFVPEKSVATGTAVIICPGGGNYYLEYESEGTAVAERLNKNGITAFVLKYRLNKTPESEDEFKKWVQDWSNRLGALLAKQKNNPDSISPLLSLFGDRFLGGEDGIKAVEYARKHAIEYNIDPDKVGIMGFSAGAGVTVHVILNSDPEKQPNFAGPIYGGWLGASKVPANAPPIFIAGAANDPISVTCPDLYSAWRAAGKSAELHMYSKGGHGFGLRKQGLPVDSWIDRFADWLKATGF